MTEQTPVCHRHDRHACTLSMRTLNSWILLIMAVLLCGAAAEAKPCNPNHPVYGLIGAKYNALRGSDGPLGCAVSEEMNHPEGRGRVQSFEHGQIGWSPNTGNDSVQAVWIEGDQIAVDWGDTAPFSYDFFLVRWDKDGQNIGQKDTSGVRSRGHFAIGSAGPGRYRIVVEGCDGHVGGSTCRQGWSNPLYVTIVPPPPPPTTGCARNIPVTGLIGEKWGAMGAARSPLGCPTTAEQDVSGGHKGRVQSFDHGQVSWSPDVWPKSVLVGYITGNQIEIEWTDVSPFGYDAFVVHWDFSGRSDQRDVNGSRTSGRFTLPVSDGGLYHFVVEGCDRRTLGSSNCRQGWTNAVDVVYAPPAPTASGGVRMQRRPVPASRNCASLFPGVPQPSGLIFNEWMRLGGANGWMGCPKSGVQRHPDGSNAGGFVQFENGVVSLSPDVWDKGVWGVYQDGDHFIIDWTTTWFDQDSFNYDKFLLRWDDGSRNDQIDILENMDKLPGNMIATLFDRKDTHLRTKGTYDDQFVGIHEGDYKITLEGCDMPSLNPLDHSGCRQGWLHPIRIHYYAAAPPRYSDFNDAYWDNVPPVHSVEESKASFQDRLAPLILKRACNFLPWSNYHHEQGYPEIIAAKLAFADFFNGDQCPGRPVDLRAEANDSLLRQRPESRAGTTMDDTVFRFGEYDFALGGFMPIIFKYNQLLRPEVANHVIDVLLNKRGKVDDADHVVMSVIPESENHINLIESSRFLTNQLLFDRTHDRQYDNRSNGVSDYWLNRLHGFMTADFIEYNAHPYQGETTEALQNLYSYSADPRVKTAAQMVLDYISAKNAVSSNNTRRSVPYRRKKAYYDDNFVVHPDPNMLRMLLLAGNTEMLLHRENGFDPGTCAGTPCVYWPEHHVPDYFIWEMLMAGFSDYRIPDPILDLLVNRDHRVFYQGFHHGADELYAGSPSYLLSAGGHYATFAYKVAGTGKGDDIGMAVPTTLMPTNAYLWRQSMIRFLGDSDDVKRSNMCVAPDFACGISPQIPAVYENGPAQCTARNGRWSFFNRSGACGHLPETPRLCGPRSSVRDRTMTDAERPMTQMEGSSRQTERLAPQSERPGTRREVPAQGQTRPGSVRERMPAAPDEVKNARPPQPENPADDCHLPGYYVAVYRDGPLGVLEAYDTFLHPGMSFPEFITKVPRNNPQPFSYTGQNTYNTVGGRQIQFLVSPDSRIVSVSGLVAPPRQATTVFGDILNSNGMSGYIVFTNPFTHQQIVLDDHNPLEPVRIPGR